MPDQTAELERRAPVEVMQELCEAAIAYHDRYENWGRFQNAMQAYRAAIRPLRTRAEVDAEIASLTRQCVDDEWAGDDDYAKWEKITALCREETAPEAEPSPEHSLTGCWKP